MAILEVKGLVKFYGRRKVVDGVSYQVDAGEVVGLLGPNGAGKTTSFRMTTGQIVPDDGRVMFNGKDVTGWAMYQRARFLVCEPNLILLDEPFAAVDPLTNSDIQKIILQLAKAGIGILLTDHNVRDVLKITNRSYLIKDGQVIVHGTPQEIIHNPEAI